LKSNKFPSQDLVGVRAIPLYEQVKRQVSELILLGTWVPATVLPGEIDLARKFGVSVGTVRRALGELTTEGLLTRRPRIGTVVTGRTPHHRLHQFFQYFRLHNTDGQLLKSAVKMISASIETATEKEQKKLQIDTNNKSQVLRLKRVRLIEGTPMMWDIFTMPAQLLPDFPLGSVPECLYIYLLEEYGIRISAVRESLSAEFSNDEDKQLLEFSGMRPIMQIEEIAYDPSGTPITWTKHRALTEGLRYVNEVN
jgi:GntR family transcriptional regulator